MADQPVVSAPDEIDEDKVPTIPAVIYGVTMQELVETVETLHSGTGSVLRQRVEQNELIVAPVPLLLDVLFSFEEDCRLDHDGNCQAHLIDNPCTIAALREVVDVQR